MIDVTWKLKKLPESAIKKRQFGTAVSLDIQNTFNSMLRARITDVLENTKVPVDLYSIIQNYLQNQVVLAQTAVGMIRKEMTCGVPQGHWTLTLKYGL